MSIVVDIILTFVTAFMAFETYKMAKSTKASVEEMEISRKEANSAEVIMYFKVESHRIYLVIENVGNTIAKNVNISYEPELTNSNGFTFEKLKQIDFLPPNYQIKTFFDMMNTYYKKYGEDPKINVKISFENIYGDIVKREYKSDLDYLKSVRTLTSEKDSVETSLHNIYKEMEKFNKKNN
ncbi:MAG: hypothetical protein IJQ68_09255 [Methanobrevibacter sp.]|uniref:hypothetical protein n=1 Tax=Methanobrevibacter sp. TaxID=66852 RepID=UPI0025CC5B0A|nr:hypothetical protein [Methanobrevibacter sp.]MBR0272153.1 hypothetical protein [Methanobrevibacter sp.]